MEQSSRVVNVEIHGQRYPIRSALDAAYVAELAAFVDEKMRLAARESPAGDTLKLAVLAALNIADECFRARDERHRHQDDVAQRARGARTHARSGARARRAAGGRPLGPDGNPRLASATEVRSIEEFEFPALRVMVGGSFEPMFHPSESRRRVVCMPLQEEA